MPRAAFALRVVNSDTYGYVTAEYAGLAVRAREGHPTVVEDEDVRRGRFPLLTQTMLHLVAVDTGDEFDQRLHAVLDTVDRLSRT